MAKSASAQSEKYRPSGPGTSYRPTMSPAVKRAKIPSSTVAVSPNSERRGKDGK